MSSLCRLVRYDRTKEYDPAQVPSCERAVSGTQGFGTVSFGAMEHVYEETLPAQAFMHGYLHKRGNMRWQRRWFELEGSMLRYFKERGDADARGELELDPNSTVATLSGKEAGFQVIVGGGKALKVAADNEEDAARWKDQIALAIRHASNLHVVMIHNQPFEIDKRYVPKRKLGVGAYGMVVSAVDHATGNKVAIKKVKGAFDDVVDAKRILREIRLMRQFNHPNIVTLRDMIRPSSLECFEDVYIITDQMSADLQQIIFSKTTLNEDQTQWILYQCLCGLKYMHSAQVLHRDLKPSNLLINTDTCEVRICDFGLSRGDIHANMDEEGQAAQEMTEYVVTRWYRAPEIMLGYHTYDYAIDVWSMGCIFGELLTRKPLLPGHDYIEQLKLIVALIGSPEEADLWFVSNRNARNFMTHLPYKDPADFPHRFPDASETALDLIRSMLTMDPAKRLTVDDAVVHDYLNPVREPENLEHDAGFTVDVADIEAIELTKPNLQRMMYEEISLFHSSQRRTSGASVSGR